MNKPHAARRRVAQQKGSAIVEFAFIVPIYYLIVFALVELGLVFAGYISAAYACQMAVRYAIVRGGDQVFQTPCSSTDITNLVSPYMWAASKTAYTVTTTWSPDNTTGSVITVAISITYKTGIPFSSLNTVQIGASSQGTILL